MIRSDIFSPFQNLETKIERLLNTDVRSLD